MPGPRAASLGARARRQFDDVVRFHSRVLHWHVECVFLPLMCARGALPVADPERERRPGAVEHLPAAEAARRPC